MITRSVQYVQSIGLPTDAVHLAVEVLDGRRVAVDVAGPEEASDDGSLADPGRPEQNQSTAVLDRCILRLRHERFLRRSRLAVQALREPLGSHCLGATETPSSTGIQFYSDIKVDGWRLCVTFTNMDLPNTLDASLNPSAKRDKLFFNCSNE